MAQGRTSYSGNNQGYTTSLTPTLLANPNPTTTAGHLAKYIAQNKRDIDQNIANLIQIGKDTTKLGKDTTYFGEKVTELDRTNKAQYENIIQNNQRLEELQSQINQAKDERVAIQDKFSNVAFTGHTHECTNCGECEFWDIGCKMNEGFEGLGKLALIGGIALVGIFLLKMRLGKK
jgi:hypothetical protein